MSMGTWPCPRPGPGGKEPCLWFCFPVLLLAYMKGNANLCRAVVRAGARLGVNNNQGVNIFNYQVATKQLLFRLLGEWVLPAPPQCRHGHGMGRSHVLVASDPQNVPTVFWAPNRTFL